MSAEILTVAQGSALAAAIEAGDLAEQHHHDQHRALALELEQATYHVALAARRYDAVDPDNRLVAAELEARWNAALERVTELEGGLTAQGHVARQSGPVVDRHSRAARHRSPGKHVAAIVAECFGRREPSWYGVPGPVSRYGRCDQQHRFALRPLPQGQGSFRPMPRQRTIDSARSSAMMASGRIPLRTRSMTWRDGCSA